MLNLNLFELCSYITLNRTDLSRYKQIVAESRRRNREPTLVNIKPQQNSDGMCKEQESLAIIACLKKCHTKVLY